MNDADFASQPKTPDEEIVTAQPRTLKEELLRSEDWWAIYLAGLILLFAATVAFLNPPATDSDNYHTPLKGWFAKPGSWQDSPLDSVYKSGLDAGKIQPAIGVAVVFLLTFVLFGIGAQVMGKPISKFLPGFCFIFLLATLAYVLTGQVYVKQYNLEYALWALGIGLIISNTIGCPNMVKPALMTEFYIKTGLVLLGSEVLITKLITLGVPGIFVAWIVTPIVLISTYIFGQKVLRVESKSLNMVISADMSVCGVSAAIATAASCRAKKEELSLAIGLSLSFTVIMMIVLPALIKFVGMSPVLGGAWLGGTIDSTGAVGVASEILGETARDVAVTIKMIQNILIGVTAFGVAVYWVSFVEKSSDGSRPQISEIWKRFPKFVLGFVIASLVFTYFYSRGETNQLMLDAMKSDCTKVLRGWCFCLAFVSIGLESDFRDLAKYLKGGKPLMLYVCGQSLNLILTLFMAWLMFEVVFKDASQKLMQ